MKYKTLFNGKYSLTCNQILNKSKIPDNFVLFENTPLESHHKIDSYQLINDELFVGHIIFKNPNDIENFNFNILRSINFNDNTIYVNEVIHHGECSKCFVDDSILICNTWALPFLLNVSRTSDSLYSTIVNHRFKIRLISKLNKFL